CARDSYGIGTDFW
nr:immunoglobulin heavy chain junction region [Macaca mulatta]